MPPDLHSRVRSFADEIQSLLNRTICDNVVLAAATHPSGQIAVGYGISRLDLTPKPFPAEPHGKRPNVWLNISYKVLLDGSQQHLMIDQSFCGIFADEHAADCLCHYDYERNKPDGYPEAHIQVRGSNPVLDVMNQPGDEDRGLDKLHFPVGGRRYRPALEDIIEFLIAERFVTPRSNWDNVLKESRDSFRRLQLRAAIRRDPDTAREALRDLDGEEEQATSRAKTKRRRKRRH